ncbi:MAG: hypothetical protein L0215_22775 [Gemmataceae bacterium]|nr:hypothetical protein [Gemmataceae bacterium]
MPKAKYEPLLVHMLSLVFVAAFASVQAMGQASGTTPIDKESIASEVRRYYDGVRKISNLHITYKLKHQHVAGAKRFGFSELDVVNGSRGEKYRTEITYKAEGKDKQGSGHRVCTWNGRVGMSMVEDNKHIDIQPHPDTLVFGYRYYFDYLGSADGWALVSKYDKLAPPDKTFWVPLALAEHAVSYQLLANKEKVDGFECHVLERPGHDKLWVDPQRGFMLRRRELYFPNSNQLRERIVARAEQLTEGAWLPRTITRELFGGRDEPKDTHNVVTNRFVLEVKNISTNPLPDSYFLLEVRDGVTVHDKFRAMQYLKLSPKDDPITASLEKAQRILPEKRGHLYLLLGIMACLVANLILARYVHRAWSQC